MRSILLVAFLGVFIPAAAQTTGPDINRYLGLINGGRADDVRRELPSLLSQYPNNPGVLYLQGLVTPEGAEAVRVYQSIVDNFPRSEWADDALYKVYQYYYALGLYRTAELKLDQLKKDYPTSKHLSGTPAVTEGQPAEQTHADTAAPQVTRTVKPAEPIQPGQQFTLQVGAYTTQVNAEKQKLFFEDLGYAVEVGSKLKDNRSLYIVLVGTFSSMEEARAKAEEFKQKYNIPSLVVTK